jgi:hypothetical protein
VVGVDEMEELKTVDFAGSVCLKKLRSVRSLELVLLVL